MNLSYEKSRDRYITAEEKTRNIFSLSQRDGICDAVYLDSEMKRTVAFLGLPYAAPICARFLSHAEACEFIEETAKDAYLFVFSAYGLVLRTKDGEEEIPENIYNAVVSSFSEIVCAKGELQDNGEHIIDLKMPRVGTHFDINLLLGCRIGFDEPLLTTPKASLDSFGRGAFRSAANVNVTSSRFDLIPEDSGEPANRQFYIFENGRQIFYSANAKENTEDAFCVHSQNHSVITYTTKCGLMIRRTIFILPYEDGMPDALEAQKIEIFNLTDKKRKLKIVATGMFALCSSESMSNDILYASITYEGGVVKKDGKTLAVAPAPNPMYLRKNKRFATLFSDGESFDDYTDNYIDFIGRGTLEHPENGAFLLSPKTRKVVPFFALGKTVEIEPHKAKRIDEYTGIVSGKGDVTELFLEKFSAFAEKYSSSQALDEAFGKMKEFYSAYSSYIKISTGDTLFDSYINNNLPFQVLYQSFVSRSFAWTQKSAREIGFREIQDIYASLYYMNAMGNKTLARKLISKWVQNVYRAGYANHNFFFSGKEAGFCSDDSLWLTQAVYRYVMLTGDTEFLDAKFKTAENDGERSLFETIKATLDYSGKISVGRHGLPVIDRGDWNDALKLDDNWLDGNAKMELYKKQLEESGEEYGAPLKSDFCESVMNAFLLKIAYDEAAELAKISGREKDAAEIEKHSKDLAEKLQQHAWKKDFFARALINHGDFEYLGAAGDGLSTDKNHDGAYFLNSYSWALLSECATEEETAIMLKTVKEHLMTKYGPVLCTPCDLEKVASRTATGLYFHGDRENGGVFKHAAMMAATASLKCAKKVKDENLARELSSLAYSIIENVLPFRTLDNPFITKGNPRFCTQYTNSETGESVGPMLSGTASWLTLAVFEILGINYTADGITLSPMLPENSENISYSIKNGATYNISVTKKKGFARVGENTKFLFDSEASNGVFPLFKDGEHDIVIEL